MFVVLVVMLPFDSVIPGWPEGPGPESITTGALGPWAIRAKQIKNQARLLIFRECGRPQARWGYGFRARRFAAPRNDDSYFFTSEQREASSDWKASLPGTVASSL
jgi:hypothetical protein